jgi:hypothetical protein
MITDVGRTIKTPYISFKAGIVNLSSDFDGTYMPAEFNHDAICRDKTPVNKTKFQEHFDQFEKTANILKGNGAESKFNFSVSSGRNIHEFNYFMQKIREKGLKILLPDSLVTGNGGDEFHRNSGDFFHSDQKEAFSVDNANKEKRENIKNETNGWDGAKIKEQIKNFFNQSEIREVQTTNLFYAPGMSLQDNLREKPSDNFVAIRNDGDLGIHLALSKNYAYNLKQTRENLTNKLKENGTQLITRDVLADSYSIGKDGEKLPTIEIFPEIKNDAITKEYDIKKKVEHIQKNRTNDLVIVAGDARNDFEMLNLFNYTNEKEDFSNIHTLKKVYDLPVISIFVNNGKSSQDKLLNSLNITADKADDYFNSDGQIRFICVDKNDPRKPQTLDEAILVATKEYAKRNPEFRKNMSSEAKAKIDSMKYSYPISKNVISQIEEKAKAKLSNHSENTDEVIKNNKKPLSTKGKVAIFGSVVGGLALVDYFIYKELKNSRNKKPQSLSNKAVAR